MPITSPSSIVFWAIAASFRGTAVLGSGLISPDSHELHALQELALGSHVRAVEVHLLIPQESDVCLGR